MNSVPSWPDSLALDESKGTEGRIMKQFMMYCTKGMKYVLFNTFHEEQDEILVSADVIQYGDMISWYRTYLISAYGIPSIEQPSPLAKDLMALFIEEYVEDSFNDEFWKVAKRFTISYKSPNMFHVRDCALGHEFHLPWATVLHPKFKLYNWWLSCIQC